MVSGESVRSIVPAQLVVGGHEQQGRLTFHSAFRSEFQSLFCPELRIDELPTLVSCAGFVEIVDGLPPVVSFEHVGSTRSTPDMLYDVSSNDLSDMLWSSTLLVCIDYIESEPFLLVMVLGALIVVVDT